MSPPPGYLHERPKYSSTTSSIYIYIYIYYITKVNKKEEKREKSEEKDWRLKRNGKIFYNWLIFFFF